MLVCKGAHRVESGFVDDVGNEYISSDMVIDGYWFECYSRPGSCNYFLRDDRELIYVYTHIMAVSKLSTLGGLKG